MGKRIHKLDTTDYGLFKMLLDILHHAELAHSLPNGDVQCIYCLRIAPNEDELINRHMPDCAINKAWRVLETREK